MTIRDPENPDAEDPIVQMLTVGSDLFVIKALSIYRVLSADTIDPAKKHPDTRHSSEKLYSVGARSDLPQSSGRFVKMVKQ